MSNFQPKSKYIVVCLTIGLCISLAYFLYSPSKTSKNDLFSLPPAIDLGLVEPNTKYEFSIPLINTSDFDIQITEAVPSCKCVQIKPYNSTNISPHTQIAISGFLEPINITGNYEELISISVMSANGKINKTKTVPIRSKVERSLELEKGFVSFGKLNYDSPMQYNVIEASSNSAFGIEWDRLHAKCSNKALEVSTESPSAGKYYINFKFAPSQLPIGEYRDTVSLTLFCSKSPLYRSYDFPVSARIMGPLAAQPSSFYVGAVNKNSKYKFTVSSETIDMKKLKVRECPNEMTLLIDHSDERSIAFEATIVYDKLRGNEKRTYNEAIILEDPNSGISIRIPFVGFIKE